MWKRLLGVCIGLTAVLAAAACTVDEDVPDGEDGQEATPTAVATNTPTSGPQGGTVTATDWCDPDEEIELIDIPNVEAQEPHVAGMEEFKGRPYCKVEFLVGAGDVTGRALYYFTEDHQDVWVVLDADGNDLEIHVRDDGQG